MIIDLTGSEDDDNNNNNNNNNRNRDKVVIEVEEDGEECEICYEPIGTGYHYTCCKHYCCMNCFRKMHINGNLVTCPFDRMPLQVNMDLIQLTLIYSHNGIYEVSIFIAISEPIVEIFQRIILTPLWTQDPELDRLPVSTLVHSNSLLPVLSLSPIYMSNLKSRDRVYLIFDTLVMQELALTNRKTNVGLPINRLIL